MGTDSRPREGREQPGLVSHIQLTNPPEVFNLEVRKYLATFHHQPLDSHINAVHPNTKPFMSILMYIPKLCEASLKSLK